jgi:transposase
VPEGAHVQAARVAERRYEQVDPDGLAADHHPLLAEVDLHLPAGRRLEPHGRPRLRRELPAQRCDRPLDRAQAHRDPVLGQQLLSHLRFLGGVPRLIVADNLKSGVHKASFYDPEINRSYGMMAAHYGVGVLPARPRKPRDKAKVEARVRFAQTYILGRLRRQTFFSLAEANAAIAAAVERINAHVMHRLGVSRRELFESIERPTDQRQPS